MRGFFCFASVRRWFGECLKSPGTNLFVAARGKPTAGAQFEEDTGIWKVPTLILSF